MCKGLVKNIFKHGVSMASSTMLVCKYVIKHAIKKCKNAKDWPTNIFKHGVYMSLSTMYMCKHVIKHNIIMPSKTM